MHRMTLFPLGNADTILIELANSRVLLVDYAHVKTDAKDDRRHDLEPDLRARLKAKKRDDVDVFCITHIDRDHIFRAHEFFHLEHAAKYQDGERFKIKELWVPAGAITEVGCEDDSRIWRCEAQHRLRTGTGIRVFGRPELLKQWMKADGINFESRKHLITDAGQIIPGFDLTSDEVEFFLHSPHAHVIDGRGLEDRNLDCVVTQAVFSSGGVQTKVILAGDAPVEAMQEIVQETKRHHNDHRLDYHVFKLPHHCSYLSLNTKENKGKTKTEPVTEVKEWFDRGAKYAKLISSSSTVQDVDTGQPPHFQAKNYYLDVKSAKGGLFKVTMEHPNALTPEPLVIEIGSNGAVLPNASPGIGGTSSTSYNPPKAG